MDDEEVNQMQQEALLAHIDKRMDELREDMKDGIGDVKTMFSDHLKQCDGNMKSHDGRLKTLEGSENKRLGAIGLLGVIVTLIGIYVAWKGGV